MSEIGSTTTCSRRRGRARRGARPPRPVGTAAADSSGGGARPRRSRVAARRVSLAAMTDLRVGIGYDAHALEEGVPLVLGGVAIDYPRGLAGHSDGDVIAHALIDALLGAANLGDIGSLLPFRRRAVPGRVVARSPVGGLSRGARGRLGARQRRLRARRRGAADRRGAGRDVRAARRRARRRPRDASRSVRRRPTASASRGAAKGSRRRPSRSCGDERRPLRRPARPPGSALRGAHEADVSRVHERERAGQSLLGPAVHGLPGLPGRTRRRRRAARRGACPPAPVGRHARGPAVRLGRGVRPRDDVRPAAHGAHGDRDQRRAEPAGAAALEPDDRDVHRQRARGGACERRHRAGATHLEGALSAHPDRALRRMASRTTGRTSTPGSASTSSWAARSSRPRRGRWSSAAPAEDWAEWTGMAFPSDGEYVFPGVPRDRSSSRTASARTSNRTCGCSTASDRPTATAGVSAG